MSSQRNVSVDLHAIDEEHYSVTDKASYDHCPLIKDSKRTFLLTIIAAIVGAVVTAVILVIILRLPKFENLDDETFLNKDRHWQSGKCEWRCSANFTVPPLLLISMDGFQAGYLERELTPAIARIYECGSHAKYMYPSYPSKTFPNHYTIVTGLYPESHGIVDNSIYDEQVTDSEKYFKKNSLCSDWYKGEPIWNTVSKNNRKSAVFYWPGSEVSIQGLPPTYRMPYNRTTPFSTRIEGVINWLRLPEADRPSFIAMYMEQPDGEGHWWGPYSDEVNSALIYVDAMLNYLIFQLEKAELLGCVNIVLVSDHGMQQLRDDHKLVISDLIPDSDIIAFDGVLSRIILKNKSADIDRKMEKLKCKEGVLYRVYEKRSIPQRYHYTRSNRIGEILIEGVAGTSFFKTKEDANKERVRGDHGYDNRMPTMRAIFAAMGPYIKSRTEIPPFQNIELYNLLADLMHLTLRAPNNGTQGLLHSILRDRPELMEVDLETMPECSAQLTFRSCGERCPSGKQLTTDGEYCTQFVTPLLPMNEGSKRRRCAVRLCNASLYYDINNDVALYAESLLTHPKKNTDERAACTIFINELDRQNETICADTSSPDKTSKRITLFANDGIWNSLWELIEKYRRHYKRILFYAGPIFDYNSDGLLDSAEVVNRENSTEPTHIFVILLRCVDGKWTADGKSCLDPELTRTLSFVLPNLSSDFNCLHPEEYLFYNTVRIRDIELLTGLEFFTDRTVWPLDVALRLRTAINEELWQLEDREFHRRLSCGSRDYVDTKAFISRKL
ncbi:Ectonucleotide pyrophosphatase/phosphodiesterase C27A7.1 [Toxocara canis]|uniref:Ectonucleotide pyrophosphatase/phosphodiesterase C27A7.1 n=1 Tax=Toxocara canis TaxID=6265 RepID=A0A0B2V4K5_TOXCA|nr:Ectonucleotide pyrophosphatase/phosphodiesterase C27A7.1 [Toxocara canis]